MKGGGGLVVVGVVISVVSHVLVVSSVVVRRSFKIIGLEETILFESGVSEFVMKLLFSNLLLF